MTKPTLLQTLLGRPSQSYSFPSEKKAYHYTKHELFRRFAHEADSTWADDGLSAGHGRSSTDIHRRRSVEGEGQLTADSPLIPHHDAIPDSLLAVTLEDDCDDDNDDDNDDNDLFYTPNTSPRTSVLSTNSTVVIPALPTSSLSAHLPMPSTSTTSLSSTLATSTDSLFSSASRSDSTRLTSLVASDNGYKRSPSPSTIGADTGVQHHPYEDPVPDRNWSKDVRWLVPPSKSTTSRKSNHAPPPSSHLASRLKPGSSSTSTRMQMQPHLVSQPAHNKKITKSVAKPIPSIMMNMAALLEEDEDSERGSSRSTHTQMHIPQSSVIIVDPLVQSSSSTPLAGPSTSTPLIPPTTLPKHQNRRHTYDSYEPMHTRSFSPPYTSSLEHTPSSSRASTPPSAFTSTPYAPSLPSHGTPGYTSLILPRAPPPSHIPLTPAARSGGIGDLFGGADGRVDLTLTGVAQTTMASVEVVRGLGASGSRRTWGTLGWRRTISGTAQSMNTSAEESCRDAPLGFSGYRTPPVYVGRGSVLVQVWAVGVDAVDGMLVAEKSGGWTQGEKGKGKDRARAEVGYIPGRSFVGRVLDCGWEVREDEVRKGEWVVGLLDVRKCGALAEFIVVDRHRVHRVPYPCMDARKPSSHGRSKSSSTVSSNGIVPTKPPAISLTLQEYALLPLCGVPAHRAVRTFLSALPDKGSSRRALVIRGHDGAGAFVVQMLVRRGWCVWVHAPRTDGNASVQGVEARIRLWGAEAVVFDDGRPGAAVRLLERLTKDGEAFDAVLDTVGGHDVWEAGTRLLRVSGRGGVFTTLVGDVPGRAVPSAGDHFRAGLRSLRRRSGSGSGSVWRKGRDTDNGHGGGQKERGNVGYAWVSVAQDVDWNGEDVRESLRAVLALALEGGVRPWAGLIVPFERAPEVFVERPADACPLGDGGTVVVKIAG